jgi:hypothetical protein
MVSWALTGSITRNRKEVTIHIFFWIMMEKALDVYTYIPVTWFSPINEGMKRGVGHYAGQGW